MPKARKMYQDAPDVPNSPKCMKTHDENHGK